MIGIREDDAGARRSDLVRRQRFDAGLSSHRHEGRGFDGRAGRLEHAIARVAIDRIDSKRKSSGRKAHRVPLRINIASP